MTRDRHMARAEESTMDHENAGSGPRHRPDDENATGDRSSTERDMARADVANGEGEPEDAANDTEEKYGEDESPA
jgi:hypothetical protein